VKDRFRLSFEHSRSIGFAAPGPARPCGARLGLSAWAAGVRSAVPRRSGGGSNAEWNSTARAAPARARDYGTRHTHMRVQRRSRPNVTDPPAHTILWNPEVRVSSETAVISETADRNGTGTPDRHRTSHARRKRKPSLPTPVTSSPARSRQVLQSISTSTWYAHASRSCSMRHYANTNLSRRLVRYPPRR
jgi:hypothetical protein